MLGWWIVITKQAPDELVGMAPNKEGRLATWETSASGDEWVARLAKEGRATQLTFNGYPNRYTAPARDVLPLIKNGLPSHNGPTVIGDDYVMPGNWTGNVQIHEDRIAACSPEQMLTIEVWDQS
jgi:hypothetical protein